MCVCMWLYVSDYRCLCVHEMVLVHVVVLVYLCMCMSVLCDNNDRILKCTSFERLFACRTGKDHRRAADWPNSKSKFPYCRFVLYKENKGTMDVVHLIARYLK